MRLAKYAPLSVILLSVAFGPLLACAQSDHKDLLVKPSHEAAQAEKQELVLKGVRTSPDAVGVRVFVDPGTEAKLDPQSKSYLGSVYFSHQEHPEWKEGSFVLPLSKKLEGPTKIVLYPVSSKGTRLSGKIDVQEAQINAVNNAAYQ